MTEVRNEQDEQTLFVRGISEEVDEEILFELFQNVSEILKILTLHMIFSRTNGSNPNII